MRLGFWNRLALVAYIGTVVIAPIWELGSQNKRRVERESALYELCHERAVSKMKAAIDAGEADTFDRDLKQCDIAMDNGLKTFDPWTWDNWSAHTAALAALGAVLYAIIWLLVWIAKWTWAGRTIKNTNPA